GQHKSFVLNLELGRTKIRDSGIFLGELFVRGLVEIGVTRFCAGHPACINNWCTNHGEVGGKMDDADWSIINADTQTGISEYCDEALPVGVIVLLEYLVSLRCRAQDKKPRIGTAEECR